MADEALREVSLVFSGLLSSLFFFFLLLFFRVLIAYIAYDLAVKGRTLAHRWEDRRRRIARGEYCSQSSVYSRTDGTGLGPTA